MSLESLSQEQIESGMRHLHKLLESRQLAPHLLMFPLDEVPQGLESLTQADWGELLSALFALNRQKAQSVLH
jgi:hypothetical protein